jgi:integrase
MPRYAEKLGQVGDYWLSQRPNSAAWCRTWFDGRTGQVRRASLGTVDFEEAKTRLVAWFIESHREKNAPISEALLSGILKAYYDRHACNLPTAEQAAIAIRRFIAFWPGAAVSILTLAEQERYTESRKKDGVALSTVSRELMVLRAAIRDAYKRQELASAPFIKEPMTKEDRDAAEPKGRPLSLSEVAELFRAAEGSERRMMLLMILFATLCRPDAARGLTPLQYDAEHQLLKLNPPGRRQTKKFRPTIPVAEYLQPWLGLSTRSHYIGTHRGPVADVKKMMRGLRADAGLDQRVTCYSARHTMARELLKRRVPRDQIELMLGHRRPNEGTTGIYAPYDPDYCVHAIAAIDDVFAALESILGDGYFRVSFERTQADAERFAERRGISRLKVVGARGIEPLTPSMSRKCSPAELSAL